MGFDYSVGITDTDGTRPAPRQRTIRAHMFHGDVYTASKMEKFFKELYSMYGDFDVIRISEIMGSEGKAVMLVYAVPEASNEPEEVNCIPGQAMNAVASPAAREGVPARKPREVVYVRRFARGRVCYGVNVHFENLHRKHGDFRVIEVLDGFKEDFLIVYAVPFRSESQIDELSDH